MPIHSNLEIPESELLAWYFNIAELQKDFIKNFGAGIDRLEGVIRSMQKFLPQEISPQLIPAKTRVAVVGFSVKQEKPIANKKFDDPARASAYLLEVLLRDVTDFVSIRKIKPEQVT